MDSGDWGDSGESHFRLRPNGNTSDHPAWVYKNDRQNWFAQDDVCTMGLDADQKVQYKLELCPGTSQLYVRLRVLGFFTEE